MNKEEFEKHIFKFNNTPTTKNARKSFSAFKKEVVRLQGLIEKTYAVLGNGDLDENAKLDNLYEIYYE